MATYRVNDVYATVQGEGCLTGTAMVLVRLQGCGVGCPWCDTKETWVTDAANRAPTLEAALGANPRWCEVEAADLARYVKDRHPGPRWILVTGGEPAEQDLHALVREFHRLGYKVAVETSGTATGHVGAGFDWVCVSPKIGMPGGKPVLPEALAAADEIKFVVGSERDLGKLEALLAAYPPGDHVQICLQPLSQSPKATQLALREAIRRGWRLSVQTHKYLGLR